MTIPTYTRIAVARIGVTLLTAGSLGLLFTQHKDRNISGHAILFLGVMIKFVGGLFESFMPQFITKLFKMVGNAILVIGKLVILNSAMNNAEANPHLPYAITAIIIGGMTAFINRDILNSPQTNDDENTVHFPQPQKLLAMQPIAPLPEDRGYAPAA